jgi:hypothetical protein
VRRRFGSSGAIRAHNLSPTNAAATAPVYIDAISRPVFGRGFVRRSKCRSARTPASRRARAGGTSRPCRS